MKEISRYGAYIFLGLAFLMAVLAIVTWNEFYCNLLLGWVAAIFIYDNAAKIYNGTFFN